ncbi:sensor histidine kinase [Halomarina pelagica]|uniref:sensor histidine kinase n=1 Tax=Halomarina pelagica TaxID=2961599 RepID=UPI0020C45361|nr:HAMP domain-containing sensor histidine kinase [Halomarina sp. BND7]
MSDRTRPLSVDRVGPAVISGIGLILAVVELEHVVKMDTPLGVVLEAGFPLALACALTYAGVWLGRNRFGREETLRVIAWFAVGTVGMLLVTAWVIVHQLIRGVPFHHTAFVLTNTAIVGGIGGFVVGAYDARSERRRRALADERRNLARERERTAFLNHLLRHNVLNAMNVVLGRADSLSSHVDDDGRDHLGSITRCSEDVVTLVQNVSTITRVVSEERETALESVDLSETLERGVENLRLAYDEAEVVARVPPGIEVWADGLLSEVFENLLLNAVQHNDDSPRVTVTASVAEDGGSAVVSIADDGPGIPDDAKRKLFRASHAELSRSGHGVGLVITRVLVRRYGGDIRVEDNEPTGTVFHVELRTTPPTPTARDGGIAASPEA